MTMIRLFTRDQNYYRKDYDVAWSASAKLPTPLPAQALSTCQSKIFLGAIAHLSDQLMVITTRLQEVERRKQYKKRKRKKPYQQQLICIKIEYFDFLFLCILASNH